MSNFNSTLQKFNQWKKNSSSPLHVNGTSPDQWCYIWSTLFASENNTNPQPQIFVLPEIEQAEAVYAQLKKYYSDHDVLIFPGLDTSPYNGFYASTLDLYKRFYALSKIVSSKRPLVILATYESLLLLNPPRHFFKENCLEILLEDIISPLELAAKLVGLGYSSSTTVEEPGTFTQKGEIFDIFPINGQPVRLHYFDDLIEHIFQIDPETNRTIKDTQYESLRIMPTPQIFSKKEFSIQLREAIGSPRPQFKNKFELRKRIFSHLSSEQLFENFGSYVPLFFKEPESLFDYVKDSKPLIHFVEHEKIFHNILDLEEELREDFQRESEDINGENLLPEPSKIYDLSIKDKWEDFPSLKISELNLNALDDSELSNTITLHLESAKSFFLKNTNPTSEKHAYIKEALAHIKESFKYTGEIIFGYKSESSLKEIKHLLEVSEFQTDLLKRVSFAKLPLQKGFFYESEKLLVICEGDLFSTKTVKTKEFVKQDLDLFAEQLATLKAGDFVIHTEHGLGEYHGLESLDVGGSKSDFLVIKYTNQDKVYVPVYKMNLIQKHADSSASLSVASLRTNKFKLIKAKAKNSAKKLAFDLLKLQAKRESAQAFSFSPPDHFFREFELAFPFQETPDQTMAIHQVLEDMQKNRPMDHLVCGDVGFGKTEVAIRASMKAVLDQKQVAVLVPTTILALQHFHSFTSRFKGFPVNIEFISRFRSAKETKIIKEKLEKGEIDILIGTHKLLSDSVKYNDLGLVIVDEEQRFGVGHKEKLKTLKSSVDFLTLTATPIPRTLQLAFLGLRDLSLIKTAPPKRQSIKTYIIKEDKLTIQTAIKKELNRGGQVFIVHNRVNDIEQFSANIRELVPEAKIVIGHGQLPERELEKRMKAFYTGEFNILIATTIIESGIDIPNANTMIIDRADTYGLSQLHQLRGRIGRSDRKAYAYFVVPNSRNLSNTAEKRLKALQTYAEMGSGFQIASCDMEIRGAGDILGGEQSGHLDAVGLELYMELLKEAIGELKGESQTTRRDFEITTPFPSFIPNTYIKDSSERLKQYKKISNCHTKEKLISIRENLEDIYGLFSEEIRNLFLILECRIELQDLGLKSMSVAGHNVNLRFDKELLDSNEVHRNKVVEFFLSRPKVYQFSPDYQVLCTFKDLVSQDLLLDFSRNLAEQIVPS